MITLLWHSYVTVIGIEMNGIQEREKNVFPPEECRATKVCKSYYSNSENEFQDILIRLMKLWKKNIQFSFCMYILDFCSCISLIFFSSSFQRRQFKWQWTIAKSRYKIITHKRTLYFRFVFIKFVCLRALQRILYLVPLESSGEFFKRIHTTLMYKANRVWLFVLNVLCSIV